MTSYTPSIPTGKTLDTKAWLVFRGQPWRRFRLSLSFSNNYCELRVHVHDHLGGIMTPEINIHENPDAFKYIMACIVFGQCDCIDSSPLLDPPDLKNTKDDDVIGKITVNENVYELLKVIFCNQGLVGCGTICYLAQRDGEEFIIKDHWVKGDKTIVLNEVEMLKTLKDIPSVPKYIEHCLVEVEPGKVDDTQMYCQKIYSSTQGVYRMHVRLVLKPQAHPLHEF
ncbi:hypothetical protein BD769DRAFT_1365817 [Suillus cothurnatus]|nr:hypothetical protein BD769DRAFT_1365817 [Suillus cothurnatus]